ncbi:DNA ligase [uncultured Oxalicibacterium sp.]|uniref:DNA ligase n=1 Tax=uncultured Oxalicibacterium sp. TaxID=1168540 RepID=UPI0025EC4293|nr:DNA ligase [uncultured Oxalicibacterium sp.]
MGAIAHAQQKPSKPPLMLANLYHPGIHLDDYWVSEKYDGMRAYWDGRTLTTRGGEHIHAPDWFIKNWPSVPLDGELWAGRGKFQEVISTARSHEPNATAWRNVRFMVFDLPAHGGVFDQRLVSLQNLLKSTNSPWLLAVPQQRIVSHSLLQKRLQEVEKKGGEGLMLHRGSSLYRAERNDDLLKMKSHTDAEAKVVAHLPGKGKHAGRLGALLVESPDGMRFRLGTGFSDAVRENPPQIGSWVTYRYRGYNQSGIPRFATYVRVRSDMPMATDAVKSR